MKTTMNETVMSEKPLSERAKTDLAAENIDSLSARKPDSALSVMSPSKFVEKTVTAKARKGPKSMRRAAASRALEGRTKNLV